MDVADRIRRYIADELLRNERNGSIDDETPLLDGLLDSGELMRLAMFIEEAFEVELDESDFAAEHFRTVREIERFLASK